MKNRVFAILMLLFYVPAIAGVSFSTHFCYGEARSTRVFSVSKQHCCCSEIEEPQDDEGGCCNDEIKLVKLDNDQLLQTGTPVLKAPAIVQTIVWPAAVASPESGKHSVFTVPVFPPGKTATKKSILHCCFII